MTIRELITILEILDGFSPEIGIDRFNCLGEQISVIYLAKDKRLIDAFKQHSMAPVDFMVKK